MEQCRGRGGVPLPIVRAVLKDRGEDETVNKCELMFLHTNTKNINPTVLVDAEGGILVHEISGFGQKGRDRRMPLPRGKEGFLHPPSAAGSDPHRSGLRQPLGGVRGEGTRRSRLIGRRVTRERGQKDKRRRHGKERRARRTGHR